MGTDNEPTGDFWYGKPKVNANILTFASNAAPRWFTADASVFISITDSLTEPYKILKDSWLDPRRLTVSKNDGKSADPLVVLSELVLGLDAAAQPLDGGPAHKGPKLLVVERWARRWQQVPAVGGWSRVSWDAPDRLGRVVRMAVRRLSRYDRHVRWLERTDPTHTPMPAESDPTIHEIPLRRTLVENEEPSTLDVRSIPHPTRIQFAYTLPSSASQSLLSAEAARRTGFAEIEVGFEAKAPTPLPAISTISAAPAPQFVEQCENIPMSLQADNPEADLHRMERMVALPTLPYHLTYSMSARPRYAADGKVDISSESSPSKASRLPSQIAVRQPTVEIDVGKTTVTLILSRYVDLMTSEEKIEAQRLDKALESTWPELADSSKVPLRHLPDPQITYTISTVDTSSSGNPIETGIVTLASILPEGGRCTGLVKDVEGKPSPWSCTTTNTETFFACTIAIDISKAPPELTLQLKTAKSYRLTATRGGQSFSTKNTLG
jgi:hypothetical protein